MTQTFLFRNKNSIYKARLFLVYLIFSERLVRRITSAGRSTCPDNFLLSPDKRISTISTPGLYNRTWDAVKYILTMSHMPIVSLQARGHRRCNTRCVDCSQRFYSNVACYYVVIKYYHVTANHLFHAPADGFRWFGEESIVAANMI